MYNLARVETRAYKRRLIGNKRSAIIALVLTGFFAVLTLLGLFVAHHSDGLLPFFMLPKRAREVADLMFYVYLFWLCILFLRGTEGKERVLVAGFCPGILLSPLQSLVSPAVATSIQYVKAIGIIVALVSALSILRSTQPAENSTSGNSALG